MTNDVRLSFRTLRKNPGFTAVAVATLALGIGMNAAVFTVTNAVLFKGFPLVHASDRILYITTNRSAVYYPDFEDWRAQAKSFEGMALVRGVFMTLKNQGDDTGDLLRNRSHAQHFPRARREADSRAGLQALRRATGRRAGRNSTL